MRSRARPLLSTAVLLVLAGGAAVFAWLGVARKDEANEARKADAAKLYAFAPEQVKALTVEAKGETTRLARSGDGWRVEAPVEAPAERAALDDLVDRLAGLRRKAAVAASPDEKALASHGLTRPRARVELVLQDGKRETFALGDESPFDGSAFVRTTGGAVEAVPGDVKWSVERSTFDLREKRVLRFDRERVALVRFTVGDATFEARPEPSAAKLSGVLSALAGLRATAFEDESGRSLAAHGLDHPARQVALLDKDGKVLDRLLVSAEKDGKAWAQAGSAPPIVRVDPASLTGLPRRADDLKEAPPASAAAQPKQK